MMYPFLLNISPGTHHDPHDLHVPYSGESMTIMAPWVREFFPIGGIIASDLAVATT
jgi:hypothetical protein